MELNETTMSSNLEEYLEIPTSVGEQTPGTDSASSLDQAESHCYSSSRLSLQSSVQSQPQPQPYPYPQTQSHREPSYSRLVKHFCPVTLVVTAGAFCRHCRSHHYSLDEDPSPPAAPPSSPALSPVGSDESYSFLEVGTERLSAEADDLERRVMLLTETIKYLKLERESLQFRIYYIEQHLRMVQEVGPYYRSADNGEWEPLLDDGSWEDVDSETELEAGSIISGQDAKELDTEIVRIDPEWTIL
ncbi:uncharacterized protein F4807DRAFT_35253 [Annulohypoxylon truncatum]|uniref:uncharacterized protein n=1 Tax=Annulohypoxylon truncatum TaxID=327061 RepID=UPI00200743F0|nr:uncharacterized protein F4807DRAFT_35253 [Annulohypoxylon truncatum]KAI1211336.1 hypothetical protein F4807DRAFT_35253 [Annulohypoxylon truncatum]